MKHFKPEPLTYFYVSRPAACPYLPDRDEQMVFTDLCEVGDPSHLNDQLSRAGFRRSQSIAYKPNCPTCSACVPLRIPVASYRMSRSMRRIWNGNKAIRARRLPPIAAGAHFELFEAYVATRHGEGGMVAMGFEEYCAMVQDSPVVTRLYEFRRPSGELHAVCLTDVLHDGLSLVYSFFDPDSPLPSPGLHIILWHIEEARRQGLPYVYLGYWIAESPKMAYKARFRPVEFLSPDGWRRLED